MTPKYPALVVIIFCLKMDLSVYPNIVKKHSMFEFMRYEKRMSVHHVQIDIKFMCFKDAQGNCIKRLRYKAINDATRIRT